MVKEGMTLIWNPKKQIHSRPQDILQAAMANLKAVGCIQFFREGTITVETIQSISPMLIEMVNGAASAKTILSAHCAHLKHRAGINLKDTIIHLKGAELRLNLQEDLGAIYTLSLLKLFWKHLRHHHSPLSRPLLLLPLLLLFPRLQLHLVGTFPFLSHTKYCLDNLQIGFPFLT